MENHPFYEGEIVSVRRIQVCMARKGLKRHLNAKNTLSGHDSIHGHRNLNETEHSVIAR